MHTDTPGSSGYCVNSIFSVAWRAITNRCHRSKTKERICLDAGACELWRCESRRSYYRGERSECRVRPSRRVCGQDPFSDRTSQATHRRLGRRCLLSEPSNATHFQTAVRF